MRRLVLRAAARRGLADIVRFVARSSGHSEVGERFADGLVTQCERLARLPGTLGRPLSELQADLRSFSFGRYLIFFRYRDATLIVVIILHSSRDVEAFFTEGP